jgi:hypothetical protein
MDLRKARVSNRGSRVHYIHPQTMSGVSRVGRSVCGQIPITGLDHPTEVGRGRWTDESVDCLSCLGAATNRSVTTASRIGTPRPASKTSRNVPWSR